MRINEFNTGDIKQHEKMLDDILYGLRPDASPKDRKFTLQQLGFEVGHGNIHIMPNGIPDIKRMVAPDSKITRDGGYTSQAEAEKYLADTLYAAQETIKAWVFLTDDKLVNKEVTSPDGSLVIKIEDDDLVVSRRVSPEANSSHGPTFVMNKDKVIEYETFADTVILRRNHDKNVLAPLGFYMVTGFNDARYNAQVKCEMTRDEFLAKYANAIDQRDKPTTLQSTYFIAQQQADVVSIRHSGNAPKDAMIINYLPTRGDKLEAISMVCPDKYKVLLSAQELKLTTLKNKPLQWQEIGGPDDPEGQRFKEAFSRIYDTYEKLTNNAIENIHNIMTDKVATPDVIRRQMATKSRMPSDTVAIPVENNPNAIDFASKVHFSDGDKTVSVRVDFEARTVSTYVDGVFVKRGAGMSPRVDNVRLAVKDALMAKKDFSKNTMCEALTYENKQKILQEQKLP